MSQKKANKHDSTVQDNINSEEQVAQQQDVKEAAEETNQDAQEMTQEQMLAAELEKSQEKIKDLENQMLYKAAEFDNYRKRTIKERADLIKNACADVVTSLLPIVDDFERAIDAEKKNSSDNKSLVEGMELVYKNLMHALTERGLKVIDTKDQDFNTDMHEAIAMVPAPAPELKGKILDCTRKGYMLNDKILRFAQVVVAQ
ncbi:MAG: nucleotide exchange factor GrpE [Bacteroidaceae bacterium]|nr:nucleotide exchange factor GrpE [Bacteroidaceae bacterium]